jgi:predicted DNA-binding transcriptional regulator YafY
LTKAYQVGQHGYHNETTTQTLTRLIKALDKRHPVTITYTKADGSETIRTIELYDIVVSAAGDILLKAMDRDSQEARSFRLDRLVSYTTHRTAYVIERPATDEPKARPAHGLATVTVLYPVDCPITTRVQLLADALAA